MEKVKTFEEMLKAYKAIRKQIIDAKLDDITCVEISEYNDNLSHHRWINISITFGKGCNFIEGQCTLVCINGKKFEQGMEAYKTALAERINQLHN